MRNPRAAGSLNQRPVYPTLIQAPAAGVREQLGVRTVAAGTPAGVGRGWGSRSTSPGRAGLGARTGRYSPVSPSLGTPRGENTPTRAAQEEQPPPGLPRPPPATRPRYSRSPSWPLASPCWRAGEFTAASAAIPPGSSGTRSGARRAPHESQRDADTQPRPEVAVTPRKVAVSPRRRDDVTSPAVKTPEQKRTRDKNEAGGWKGGGGPRGVRAPDRKGRGLKAKRRRSSGWEGPKPEVAWRGGA